IALPKELVSKGFAVLPRKEYEEFLRFRFKTIREIKMTPAQKKALARARKNLLRGKFFTLYELKRKLGIKD
ncbi:MAG: hypothetical protein G01um101472_399, partial [Parcubacteria group bacterium Gr01-1014_72]